MVLKEIPSSSAVTPDQTANALHPVDPWDVGMLTRFNTQSHAARVLTSNDIDFRHSERDSCGGTAFIPRLPTRHAAFSPFHQRLIRISGPPEVQLELGKVELQSSLRSLRKLSRRIWTLSCHAPPKHLKPTSSLIRIVELTPSELESLLA